MNLIVLNVLRFFHHPRCFVTFKRLRTTGIIFFIIFVLNILTEINMLDITINLTSENFLQFVKGTEIDITNL